LSDKDFKVKNKLQVKGITSAGPVVSDASGNLDSTTYIATQYGGTGTSTSPSSGQVLYSSAGTTYSPTTLSSLIQGAKYQADAPSSPAVGDIWIESDSDSDSFDPNLLRRQAFTATAGQTVFTTSISFVDGYEQVYFNGMLLLRNTDYTVSSSTEITLSSAAAVNDIVEIVTITNLNSVNTYTASEITDYLAAKANLSGPTFTGTVTIPAGAAISGYKKEVSSAISANTTLVAGRRYFVTSASALTLTLPVSPAQNDQVDIFDASGNSATYNITLGRNSSLINGNAGNFIIDANGYWASLVYTGATYGWKVG
jgi:hypothetical protein